MASFVLPISIAIILAVGRLLAAAGDDIGARVLDRIALAGGIIWAIDLISLITVQGVLWLASESQDVQEGGEAPHHKRLD